MPLAQPWDLGCHTSTLPEPVISSCSWNPTREEEVAEFLCLVQDMGSHYIEIICWKWKITCFRWRSGESLMLLLSACYASFKFQMQFYNFISTNVVIAVCQFCFLFLKCLKCSPNEVKKIDFIYYMVFLVDLFWIFFVISQIKLYIHSSLWFTLLWFKHVQENTPGTAECNWTSKSFKTGNTC